MARLTKALFYIVLFCSTKSILFCQEQNLYGREQYSFYYFDNQQLIQNNINTRLGLKKTISNDLYLTLEGVGDLTLNNKLTILPPVPSEGIDLSYNFNNKKDFGNIKIDRLYIIYNKEQTAINIGRSALSIGNSLIFPLIDIINPFSPFTIDQEYKPGSDIFQLQHISTDNKNIISFLIAKKNKNNQFKKSYLSAVSLKYLTGELETFALIGNNANNPIVALSLSHPFKNYLLKSDFLFEKLYQEQFFSFNLGVNKSFSIANKDTYFALEYFFNDYKNKALKDKITKGELFSDTKHNLGLILNFELNLDLQLKLTALLQNSLKKYGGTAFIEYRLMDNITIKGGTVIINGYNSTLNEFNPIQSSNIYFIQTNLYF